MRVYIRVKYLLLGRKNIKWVNPLDSNIVSVYQYLLQGHQVKTKNRSTLATIVLRNIVLNATLYQLKTSIALNATVYLLHVNQLYLDVLF